MVADGLAHAAHLALAALVEDDLDHALPGRRAQDAHASGRGAAPVQLDAGGERGRRLGAQLSHHGRLVGLLDAVTRVHQPRGQLSVVREQEQARRVRVEPAHGEEATIGADQVDHGSPSVRVAHGRDDVGRLVQQHVGVRLGCDGTPVERDARAFGDALSRRRGDDAVD